MPILGILASSRPSAANSYESISTVTLTGTQASIEFTSIASTYSHLQIRLMARSNRAGVVNDSLQLQFNSDTGTNYDDHYLIGDGSTAWSALLYQTAKITTVTKSASATLALTDAGKVVETSVATANNLTIPLNSSVAFPIGTQILVIQVGAGQTTLVATSGVTLNAKSGNLKITGQWSAVTLIKRATNTWVAIGDLSA